jgi:hypothetical protein
MNVISRTLRNILGTVPTNIMPADLCVVDAGRVVELHPVRGSIPLMFGLYVHWKVDTEGRSLVWIDSEE